jgi:hypothetical protein
MPTYDGGYCFLTALLPISTKQVEESGGIQSSPVHLVREALSRLAPAHQSPPTMKGTDSPFASDNKTHFARFAVIDDTTYNGRMPTSAIFDQSNRLIPQPIDQLNCPYLLLAIDFDARKGDPSELRAYLHDLWTRSASEFEPIFKHCFGFPKTPNADSFADYVMARQVETTMPFNDYRPDDTPLKARPEKLSNSRRGQLVKYAIVLFYVACFCALYFLSDRLGFMLDERQVTGSWANVWYYAWPVIFTAEILILLVLSGLIVGFGLYVPINMAGSRRFPFKPGSDLPSVLKALYLQREFSQFVIRAQDQGFDDRKLQTEFATFIAEHQSKAELAGKIPK